MKTILKTTLILSFSIVATLFISSCVEDKYDEPDPTLFTAGSANTTIADLKALYDGDTTLIADSITIRGNVISTDKFGNFYKELIIQDSTGGISISLDLASIYNDYPLGSDVLVECGGLYLGEYGGVTQLGSLYEDNGIWKFGRLQGLAQIQQRLHRDDRAEPIEPKIITIPERSSALINTLIQIENVEFTDQNLGFTYADGQNNVDKNRDIQDCDKNTSIIRTSGYARFANDTVPEGNGTIIAVLGAYNGDYQLKIRDTDDVDMTGERCIDPNLVSQDFSAGFGDWETVSVIGDQAWYIDTYGNPAPCATMKGYDGSNQNENEDWLISPAFNSNEHESLILNFESASGYSGNDIEVLISTDYDGGGNPGGANWTALTATLSNSWTWISSGDIDISNYKGDEVYVAFKYTSTSSSGKTWEIDNIAIFNPEL